MNPFDRDPAGVGIHRIAAEDQYRHAVGVGVVDRHRSVLYPDGAVHHHHHRLAGNLVIALRHRDRDFLVQAGQPFRVAVAAMVDERLVQAAETGPRVGGDVVDIEGLDHVDHEIGTGPFNRQRRINVDTP